MADFGTVARPYARAVFDVALQIDALGLWSEGLAAGGAIAGDKAAREFLSRPELSDSQRSEFLANVLAGVDGGTVWDTAEGKNLLTLLAENDRLSALGEISAEFDRLKDEQENKVKVTLTSASPVDAEQAEKVAAALSKKFGRSVELELGVDPSLLGGAVIRAKDMVIDDSLQTRLKRLADSLAD